MIIHNPEITGSLSFPRQDGTKVIIQLSSEGGLETVVADATGSVTGTPQSNFSGSFTGSFVGDGSQLVFNSTGIISSSAQLSTDFLDTLGDGVISGSSQVEFNDVNNTPFSQSVSSVTTSKSIVPTSATIDLGSSSSPFRDLYLSSASLYIDGQQVISSDANDLTITTDVNQSLKLVETSADTITLQTENGDITLAATGTGNIELNAPVQILAGKQILSSDGNAIQIGEDISVTGNITVTGTVDGVDVATLNSSFGTLSGKTLVSGSSQIDVEQTTNFNAFSASIANTFDGLSSNYADLIGIPSGIISGSSQVELSSASGFGSISSHISSTSNPHSVTATQVGLGNVDNTSDADKPISTAQQNGLDGKVSTDSAQALGAAANVLTLSSNNLVLTRGDGSTDSIDLSAYLDEDSRSIASGTLDGPTGIVTFTRDDASTFTLDLSDLLDDTNLVTSVNTKAGVVTLVTDDIAEDGSPTNLWFTTARARDAFSAGTGVSISSGQISIGQAVGTTSTVQFGKVGVGGASDATYELKVTGDIGATGDVVAYVSSDERLKNNIELISNPIEKVQSLRGVTWEWNDNASEAAKQSPNLGVIAQEVEKVLPQLVHDRENGYKGVDYSKLTGLLIEAIKEQQKQIDELKSRLG